MEGGGVVTQCEQEVTDRGWGGKRRALGEKQKLMERQRQRAIQPVKEKREKMGKQSDWKRSKRRRERINLPSQPATATDWLQLPAKHPCGVCVSLTVYWLATTLWLLQREVSMTYPITDEKDPAHFLVSPSHTHKTTDRPLLSVISFIAYRGITFLSVGRSIHTQPCKHVSTVNTQTDKH